MPIFTVEGSLIAILYALVGQSAMGPNADTTLTSLVIQQETLIRALGKLQLRSLIVNPLVT